MGVGRGAHRAAGLHPRAPQGVRGAARPRRVDARPGAASASARSPKARSTSIPPAPGRSAARRRRARRSPTTRISSANCWRPRASRRCTARRSARVRISACPTRHRWGRWRRRATRSSALPRRCGEAEDLGAPRSPPSSWFETRRRSDAPHHRIGRTLLSSRTAKVGTPHPSAARPRDAGSRRSSPDVGSGSVSPLRRSRLTMRIGAWGLPRSDWIRCRALATLSSCYQEPPCPIGRNPSSSPAPARWAGRCCGAGSPAACRRRASR